MKTEEFLQSSYTCYHAAENGARLLQQAGFVPLNDKAEKNAAGYYRVAGGSLFAARVGSDDVQLVLAHTDSPCLRVRASRSLAPDAHGYTVVGTEKYGGGLLRSFLDRKLTLAGRVAEYKDGVLQTRNVCAAFPVVIPSLAVHLGAGQEGESLTLSRDFRPLIGSVTDLWQAVGAADAVDGELYLVPCEAPYRGGAGGEYLCAPRIDNLVSVHAALQALVRCDNGSTCVAACFNSEETGSETREGACGRLLFAFLDDLFALTNKKTTAEKALNRAFAISCDGAHAVHPTHAEKHAENAPVLGGGVVIKHNDRYATDTLSAAAVRTVFSRAGLRMQDYYHNPDLRCGSTIGLTAANRYGCRVCDIGVAQLSMHSAVETAALSDIEALTKGLTEFFSTAVTQCGDELRIG